MRALGAAVAVVFAVIVPASAAFAQAAPDATEPPPVSLPPGIPTVDPPVDPAAPPAEPVAPIADPSPKVAVVMAQLHVLDAQKAVAAADSTLRAARTEESRYRRARDTVRSERDAKRATLTAVATDAYVRGGNDVAGSEPATMDEYLPAASTELLTGRAIDHDVNVLEDAEDHLRQAENALSEASGRTAQAQTARDAAQAAADEAVVAVSDARKLTSRKDASPTVMGDAVLTADEIVGWYRAQGVVGYVGKVDLATMAALYIDEGNAEGIRGDVAFAQSIVETGAFTSPLTTHNNFAGIGACDSCPTGFDFPTPQLGVRAQAQLLHAYADKTLRVSTLAHPAIGSNPDRLSVRGCCTTWNKLTGTWATDPNYGPKLMTVYLSMLEYALAQRSLPPPTDGSAPLPSLAGP